MLALVTVDVIDVVETLEVAAALVVDEELEETVDVEEEAMMELVDEDTKVVER